MSKLMHFTALLLLVAAVTVSARPDGAPACAINAEAISKMGGPSGVRDFKVVPSAMSYTPGQKIDVKLESATHKTFKGILCYVSPKSDAKSRVGKFKIDPAAPIRSNVDKCAPKGIKAETDSVITHKSKEPKPINTPIEWTAPATAVGDVMLNCVVVGDGPPNWQILEPQLITGPPGGNSGAANTTPPPAGNMGGNNGYGMRKCKKWRKKGTYLGGGNGNAAPADSPPAYNGGTAPPPPPAPATGGRLGLGSDDGTPPAQQGPASVEGGTPPPAEGEAQPPAEGGAPVAEGGAPPTQGGGIDQQSASAAFRPSSSFVAAVGAALVAVAVAVI